MKDFPDTTRDPKENLYNEKLRSTRIVTENRYGMLKGSPPPPPILLPPPLQLGTRTCVLVQITAINRLIQALKCHFHCIFLLFLISFRLGLIPSHTITLLCLIVVDIKWEGHYKMGGWKFWEIMGKISPNLHKIKKFKKKPTGLKHFQETLHNVPITV